MALQMGISTRDFWKMTLREFFYFLDGYNKRQANEFRLQRALVWQGEALRRTKKLMSLRSFLFEGRTRVPKEQELKEMRTRHNDLATEFLTKKKAM